MSPRGRPLFGIVRGTASTLLPLAEAVPLLAAFLSLTQAAIRFILMHQGVTVVLGGFSALDHLEEIAPVLGTGPLAPELMARVEKVWRPNFGFVGPPPPAGDG